MSLLQPFTTRRRFTSHRGFTSCGPFTSRTSLVNRRGLTLFETILVAVVIGVLAVVYIPRLDGTKPTTKIGALKARTDGDAAQLLSWGTQRRGFSTLTLPVAAKLMDSATATTPTSTAATAAYVLLPGTAENPSAHDLVIGRCLPAYFDDGGRLCTQVRILGRPTTGGPNPLTRSLICPERCAGGRTALTTTTIDAWPDTPTRTRGD